MLETGYWTRRTTGTFLWNYYTAYVKITDRPQCSATQDKSSQTEKENMVSICVDKTVSGSVQSLYYFKLVSDYKLPIPLIKK